MTEEERTRAIVAAIVSKETICQFGTPKDWAWLAMHVTPFRPDDGAFSGQGLQSKWCSRVLDADKLLQRAGAKKRGVKQARARLDNLLRRYIPLLPVYYLRRVAVRSKGKFPANNYKRLVLVKLAKGTRRCDFVSFTSKCVEQIIADSGPVHIGKTTKSKGVRVLAELEQCCAQLNKEHRYGTTKA